MKKRDFLKNIGLSSLGLAVASPDALASEVLEGPKPKPKAKTVATATPKYNYGRTKDEMERDARLLAEKFYTDHEMKTITVLSDIIIPADKVSGSASQAGVPAFIEFITKDNPSFKTPMRGGLRWLDSMAIKRFGKDFISCTAKEQINIVDDIAYPNQAKKEFSQGVAFFTYQGNKPNNWEGVPDEVLKQYGLSYS
ncbi:MAG: gluconate 2-dehydrogenase subunit 3 family protein [Arcicella sp.]|nr:gluconate 2-dehydrogenase subunit 3 family protein [Arcicella sp.]